MTSPADTFLRSTLAALLIAVPAAAVAQGAEDVAPSFSRDGSDYFSAPIERPETKAVAHACEKQFGKNVEVQPAEKERFVCSVTTPSEPRLSARLREEMDLIGDVSEPKRQKVVNSLVDKYRRLAQCPAGTEATYDGAMYFCQKTYSARELCPAGAPAPGESGQLGCVVSTCAKGLTDLGALTGGKHPGCFRCPRGSWDAKETDAFHGALKGMPADYTEVFCRAKASGPAAK